MSVTIRFTVVIVGSRQKVFNLQIFKIFFSLIVVSCYLLYCGRSLSNVNQTAWFSAFTGRQTSQIEALLLISLR